MVRLCPYAKHSQEEDPRCTNLLCQRAHRLEELKMPYILHSSGQAQLEADTLVFHIYIGQTNYEEEDLSTIWQYCRLKNWVALPLDKQALIWKLLGYPTDDSVLGSRYFADLPPDLGHFARKETFHHCMGAHLSTAAFDRAILCRVASRLYIPPVPSVAALASDTTFDFASQVESTCSDMSSPRGLNPGDVVTEAPEEACDVTSLGEDFLPEGIEVVQWNGTSDSASLSSSQFEVSRLPASSITVGSYHSSLVSTTDEEYLAQVLSYSPVPRAMPSIATLSRCLSSSDWSLAVAPDLWTGVVRMSQPV